MQEFTTLTSLCIPFFKDDVDTDQIIPARFLTGISKTGLGNKLFYDRRYHEDGSVRQDSIFDSPQYAHRQLLVSGHNFGCGSSREHAPWSLKDYGIRAIIAVSFADIFFNNALKNFLLPIALPDATVKSLIQGIERNPDLEIRIDVRLQQVDIPGLGTFDFQMNAFRKKCLMEGLDDIAYVLSYSPQIEVYEQARQAVR